MPHGYGVHAADPVPVQVVPASDSLREQLEQAKQSHETTWEAMNAYMTERDELREQLEQERAKRKAHAKASLNQQLERNRYREALERITNVSPALYEHCWQIAKTALDPQEGE